MSADALTIFYAQQQDPETNAMAAFRAREGNQFMAHWTMIMSDLSITLKTILFDDQLRSQHRLF